jgi:UDP-2,3-diacylglucosamine hydrolase
VVRGGAVIAVEGIEGKDATIRRAGQLAGGDIVLVKVCKPTQDTRFDLPAVGPGTVAALAQVQGRALAVEAGKTVTLDRAELVALADRTDIAVVAVDGTEGER